MLTNITKENLNDHVFFDNEILKLVYYFLYVDYEYLSQMVLAENLWVGVKCVHREYNHTASIRGPYSRDPVSKSRFPSTDNRL